MSQGISEVGNVKGVKRLRRTCFQASDRDVRQAVDNGFSHDLGQRRESMYKTLDSVDEMLLGGFRSIET